MMIKVTPRPSRLESLMANYETLSYLVKCQKGFLDSWVIASFSSHLDAARFAMASAESDDYIPGVKFQIVHVDQQDRVLAQYTAGLRYTR